MHAHCDSSILKKFLYIFTLQYSVHHYKPVAMILVRILFDECRNVESM